MVFATTLITVLLSVSTLTLFKNFARPFSHFSLKNKPEWLFGIQVFFVLGWQLINIRNEEYNVDESTWIADALAVIADKNFFSALLTHTTSRPVMVLPLIILGKLQLPIDFYSVKVVVLLCIVLTLALTYFFLRNLTNAWYATLFVFPLTIFYLAVQFDDFLAYNSEVVCNVLLTSGVWFYSLIVRKRDRLWQLYLVGLLLGIIPFAKFQAIPGALVVAGFCLYEWVRQRRYTAALLFIGAGLMPIIAAVCYCLFTGQMSVLIRQYFLYYVYYSSQYSPKPLAERFTVSNIVGYYQLQHTFAAYWDGLLLLMAIGLWRARRVVSGWSSTTLMVALFWVISIYATIQAGTNFEHYLHLVLIPHTLLAALLIYPRIKGEQIKPMPVMYSYLAVALLITFFSRTKPYARGYKAPLPYDSEVVALIKKECGSQGRLAIWGWADRYYVLSGVAPASRYCSSVLQMGVVQQQDYYLDQYVRDLRQSKPILLLDAVAENQFMFRDRNIYGHEKFPTVNQVFTDYYQLIYEREGFRAYKLKSAIRDNSVALSS